jgi:protein TonB
MRYLVSTALGIAVALLLFLIMNSLISGKNTFDRNREEAARLDFIKVDQDELENIKKRSPPPKPEPPKKPPPPPRVTISNPDQPQPDMPQIDMPRISLGVSAGGGPYLGNWSAGDPSADGDIIPIVRIEPQFPREALIRGISGWVEVEFTIEPDGSVSNPRVSASSPSDIFNRDAIRAIFKWKFKPRIVDGKPVTRQAKQRLEFNLND